MSNPHVYTFVCFQVNKPIRLPSNIPTVQNIGSVMDFTFDPFNHHRLVVGEYSHSRIIYSQPWAVQPCLFSQRFHSLDTISNLASTYAYVQLLFIEYTSTQIWKLCSTYVWTCIQFLQIHVIQYNGFSNGCHKTPYLPPLFSLYACIRYCKKRVQR